MIEIVLAMDPYRKIHLFQLFFFYFTLICRTSLSQFYKTIPWKMEKYLQSAI